MTLAFITFSIHKSFWVGCGTKTNKPDFTALEEHIGGILFLLESLNYLYIRVGVFLCVLLYWTIVMMLKKIQRPFVTFEMIITSL